MTCLLSFSFVAILDTGLIIKHNKSEVLTKFILYLLSLLLSFLSYIPNDTEREKRDFGYDKQVEVGGDSSQLYAKGFMERRRKWGYQKEIKM